LSGELSASRKKKKDQGEGMIIDVLEDFQGGSLKGDGRLGSYKQGPRDLSMFIGDFELQRGGGGR